MSFRVLHFMSLNLKCQATALQYIVGDIRVQPFVGSLRPELDE